MSSGRDFRDYLNDIRDSIEKIERFIEGMTLKDFEDDDKTFYAVIRAFEVMGEATKKIPKSFRNKYPKVPWSEMAGIRDKLVHDYFGVNLEVVWNTANRDIPELKPLISEILEKEL